MKLELQVSAAAREIVSRLINAGYESYIVGGAVRDLLLGRTPKDFDISTSATPEEIRQVFGRRQARIIGKRFRLVHVFMDGDIYEVSTFRSAPRENGSAEYDPAKPRSFGEKPENLILSDNSYGTAMEDAWRRDFTVNALFYNPLKCEVLDLTGTGLDDIKKHVVRAIGTPALRFEEDPVRMLRALKLVAQFDFALDDATENALFASLPLLLHASTSRLALELEKILKSSYSDRHFEVCHDYGLLPYFLPELSRNWGTPQQKEMIKLLYERNCRVDEGLYRNSVSLALAAAALPFAEAAIGHAPGTLWDSRSEEVETAVRTTVDRLFEPQMLMVRMRESACRVLLMQSDLESKDRSRRGALMQQRAYSHARELLLIRHRSRGEDISGIATIWPQGVDRAERTEFFPRRKSTKPRTVREHRSRRSR